MENSTDLLKVRVESLESTFFGSSPLDPSLVASKLHAILEKLYFVEAEVPNIKLCCDTIQKLHPLVYDKKTYLMHIGDKVDSLLLKKEELMNVIQDLDAINQLSHVIDSEVFRNIGVF